MRVKQKRIKRIGWIAGVCLVLLAVAVSFFAYSGQSLKKTMALKSEHYTVSNAMLSYFIRLECEEYVARYENYAGSDYLSVVGLDPTKSLKGQECCYEQDTWFDYFADQALQRARKILACCEAALSADTVDEEDVSARAENRINVLQDRAQKAGKPFKTYLAETYGKTVTEEEVKAAARLQAMADVYYASVLQGESFTDAELTAFVQDNLTDFLYADYQCYSVIPTFDEGDDEEKIMAEAKKTAEKLAEKIREDGFEAAVSAYIASLKEETATQDLSVTAYKYNPETNLGAWLFGADTQKGDTTVIQGNGMYTVYYRVSDVYKLEYASAKLQLIVVKPDEFDDVEQMKDTFNALESGLQNYDGTEETFREVAADAQTLVQVNDGALKGEYNTPLIDEWIFDTQRKVGDFERFTTEEATYYIRYAGSGEVCWKVQARLWLAEEKQEEYDKQLLENCSITQGKILSFLIPG